MKDNENSGYKGSIPSKYNMRRDNLAELLITEGNSVSSSLNRGIVRRCNVVRHSFKLLSDLSYRKRFKGVKCYGYLTREKMVKIRDIKLFK